MFLYKTSCFFKLRGSNVGLLVLIGGDFNYKEIDWENEFVEECNIHLTPFINTIQDHFLMQHVTEPTRYRQGEQPNLLDLILTNEEGMVQNLTYHPGLGDSDHCCLKFDLNCYAHYSNTTEKSMNYYKANYRAIRNKLRMVNWDETLNGSFMDDYTKFLDNRIGYIRKYTGTDFAEKEK